MQRTQDPVDDRRLHQGALDTNAASILVWLHRRLDPFLCAVEPAAAHLLELPKLSASGPGFQYAPSRNRQCHMYAVTQKRDARSLALKRVFVR